MAEIETRHYLISGKVQGVGFRASTEFEARRLGLTGWVKNRPDGQVEAEASGTDAALAQFGAWLEHGPGSARVDRVTTASVRTTRFDDFRVR